MRNRACRAMASFRPSFPSHPSPSPSVPALQPCPPGSAAWAGIGRKRPMRLFEGEAASTEIPGRVAAALRFPPLRGGASVISVAPGEQARALGPCEDGSGCDGKGAGPRLTTQLTRELAAGAANAPSIGFRFAKISARTHQVR